MTLYSHNRNTPQPLPEKVTMPNGFTRTDSSTFTAEELAEWGYVAAPDKPSYNDNFQKCLWVNTEWVVSDYNDDEKAARKQMAWAETLKSVYIQQHTAYKIYMETRKDVDANKQPMYLLSVVDAYLSTITDDAVYDTWDETTAQFSVPAFPANDINPDWDPS